MKTIRAMIALAVCMAASACATPGEPSESPSVVGAIAQVQQDRTPTRFLVEHVTSGTAGEPTAWVDVVSRTRIYERRETGLVRVSADALQVGDRVTVWFTGPVRESYPVQAVGGTIILEN